MADGAREATRYTDHLTYEWWFEEDCLGLWVAHLCNGEVKEWHPDNRWHLTDEGPRPSFSCDQCGAHSILQNVDHRDRLVARGTSFTTGGPHGA